MSKLRLESRADGAATIVTGRPLNDTLHMLLAVITLGLWLPPEFGHFA